MKENLIDALKAFVLVVGGTLVVVATSVALTYLLAWAMISLGYN